ncbi:MAG: acyltransferase [Bacteroidia bacterium]|nr:acyltransferase [Bacteroidota bacterium]MBP6411953.1 acyltransferase [Bacteroidia bacterium]
MFNYFDFEDIRPYSAEEFASAWNRIKDHPTFHAALQYLFSEGDRKKIVADFPNFNSTSDFQLKIMHRAIRNILSQSSAGLSSGGFENIAPNVAYTFISNHRDIFLDSGILQILLVEHGHDTSEITFGNNLMVNQFLIDIGKVNKMFTVYRTGNRREIYDNSIRLSNYMRFAITSKKQSTWIAQRNGRTKNGWDETQVGLLKMLQVSKPENFEESFAELNIVPVSISYEFEPCDILKVRENYLSMQGNYTKSADEDVRSILAGVTENKGRVHLQLGQPLNRALPQIAQASDNMKALNNYMDAEISGGYQLFPTNYIAFDLLNTVNDNKSQYTVEQHDYFIHYMQEKLKLVQGDNATLQKLFLELYANPVANSRKFRPTELNSKSEVR